MMLIGELAKKSHFSRDTIRYYEKIGLLDEPAASANGYKQYQPAALARLQEIHQLKEIGFTLNEIHMLLGQFAGTQPCTDLPELLTQKISVIDEKIAQLKKFRRSLENTRQTCTPECQIISGLPVCLKTGEIQFYSPD